jgi:hypothetical protein
VLGHGVAHDAAAADVEDVGQVEPAFVGPDVGDVAAAALARLARAEVACDQVGSGGALTSGMVVRTLLGRPSLA